MVPRGMTYNTLVREFSRIQRRVGFSRVATLYGIHRGAVNTLNGISKTPMILVTRLTPNWPSDSQRALSNIGSFEALYTRSRLSCKDNFRRQPVNYLKRSTVEGSHNKDAAGEQAKTDMRIRSRGNPMH